MLWTFFTGPGGIIAMLAYAFGRSFRDREQEERERQAFEEWISGR